MHLRKSTIKLGVIVCAALIAFAMIACDTTTGGGGGNQATSTVTSVSVSPSTATIALDGTSKTQQFTVDVAGTGAFAKTVKWEVLGNDKPATTISDSGLLTVAGDEVSAAEVSGTITVKATSTVNASISGTAAVTVYANSDDVPITPAPTVPAALLGEWDAGSDSYTITETTLTYGSIAGTIKHVQNLEGAPSGVIVIQYTTAPEHATVGNYTAVYYDRDPAGKILDFATATDFTADPLQTDPWEIYPPVNESDLNTALKNFTTGEYLDKYIYGGTWSAFSPYYRADYIPPEIAGGDYFQRNYGDFWYAVMDINVVYDDGFKIDPATKTFYSYGNSVPDINWSGTIVKYVPAVTYPAVEPARLIVRIDDNGTWYPDESIGKYMAVSFKLGADGLVENSTAYGATPNGMNTVAEAISEYTTANSYYGAYGSYYKHITAETLGDLTGLWRQTEDETYTVDIRGTAYVEYIDAEKDGVLNDMYMGDGEGEDELYLVGPIEASTDTTQSSGILYLFAGTDMAYGFSPKDYAAIAWKNKTATGVEFAISDAVGETLDEIKALCNNANDVAQFPAESFFAYTK